MSYLNFYRHTVGRTVLVCFFFFLCFIWESTNELAADIFFVDDSVNASDDNLGTASALPLRTINAAIQKAGPGDVVVVRSGDYRDEDSGFGPGVIPVQRSGTDGNEIRIVGSRNSRVVSFLIRNCEHVRVQGFQFFNTPLTELDANWKDMPAIVRDVLLDPEDLIDFTADYSQRQDRIEAMFATYLGLINELKYCTAVDLVNAQHVTVVDNWIDGYWAGIQCRGCRDIRIVQNNISHCVNGIFTWIPSPGLTDSFIRGNRITHSLDTGIFIRRQSDNVSVVDNFVAFSGINHISLEEGVTNSTVANNDVRRGGYYSETMRFPGSSAININGCGVGNVLTDNWAQYQTDLTGIDGNGLIVDLMLDGHSVRVSRNFSLRNMGSGLNMTASPNAFILDNCFIQNGFLSDVPGNGAGVKLSRQQDIDNVIARNMFINNREAGILSDRTITQQLNVNFNFYQGPRGKPLISDGFDDGPLNYETLEEVQAVTGWEVFGDSNR